MQPPPRSCRCHRVCRPSRSRFGATFKMLLSLLEGQSPGVQTLLVLPLDHRLPEGMDRPVLALLHFRTSYISLGDQTMASQPIISRLSASSSCPATRAERMSSLHAARRPHSDITPSFNPSTGRRTGAPHRGNAPSSTAGRSSPSETHRSRPFSRNKHRWAGAWRKGGKETRLQPHLHGRFDPIRDVVVS